MFRLKNNNIVTESGQDAFDVDKKTQNIIVNKLNGKDKQIWTILYVDEDKPDPVKGELNEFFGIKVETGFHIISKMGSGRFLDLIDNRLVIKTPNGFKTQEWYFDQTTKTIKSASNDLSWDIMKNGIESGMQVYNTNSQWW